MAHNVNDIISSVELGEDFERSHHHKPEHHPRVKLPEAVRDFLAMKEYEAGQEVEGASLVAA